MASLNNFEKKIIIFINGKSNVNTDIAEVPITIIMESPLMMKMNVPIKKWKISIHSTTKRYLHRVKKISSTNINEDHIATIMTLVSK